MCILIAEIIMILGGLYALIAGKLTVTRNAILYGWPARIAGIILLLPIPLVLTAGFIIGVLIEMDTLPSSAFGYVVIVELLSVLGCLLMVAIIGAMYKEDIKLPPEELGI